jgi:hypothetical protein
LIFNSFLLQDSASLLAFQQVLQVFGYRFNPASGQKKELGDFQAGGREGRGGAGSGLGKGRIFLNWKQKTTVFSQKDAAFLFLFSD